MKLRASAWVALVASLSVVSCHRSAPPTRIEPSRAQTFSSEQLSGTPQRAGNHQGETYWFFGPHRIAQTANTFTVAGIALSNPLRSAIEVPSGWVFVDTRNNLLHASTFLGTPRFLGTYGCRNLEPGYAKDRVLLIDERALLLTDGTTPPERIAGPGTVLVDAAFPTADFGVVLGEFGTVYRTVDHGRHWEPLALRDAPSLSLSHTTSLPHAVLVHNSNGTFSVTATTIEPLSGISANANEQSAENPASSINELQHRITAAITATRGYQLSLPTQSERECRATEPTSASTEPIAFGATQFICFTDRGSPRQLRNFRAPRTLFFDQSEESGLGSVHLAATPAADNQSYLLQAAWFGDDSLGAVSGNAAVRITSNFPYFERLQQHQEESSTSEYSPSLPIISVVVTRTGTVLRLPDRSEFWWLQAPSTLRAIDVFPSNLSNEITFSTEPQTAVPLPSGGALLLFRTDLTRVGSGNRQSPRVRSTATWNTLIELSPNGNVVKRRFVATNSESMAYLVRARSTYGIATSFHHEAASARWYFHPIDDRPVFQLSWSGLDVAPRACAHPANSQAELLYISDREQLPSLLHGDSSMPNNGDIGGLGVAVQAVIELSPQHAACIRSVEGHVADYGFDYSDEEHGTQQGSTHLHASGSNNVLVGTATNGRRRFSVRCDGDATVVPDL